MFAVPSLYPKRLRGVSIVGARGRGLAETELGPAQGDRPEGAAGEVADGVHGDVRVVGAGLDAQVAVAAGGVEGVPGEVGERLEGLRPPVGETEPVPALPVDEEGGSEAEGDRQPRGRQPDR